MGVTTMTRPLFVHTPDSRLSSEDKAKLEEAGYVPVEVTDIREVVVLGALTSLDPFETD